MKSVAFADTSRSVGSGDRLDHAAPTPPTTPAFTEPPALIIFGPLLYFNAPVPPICPFFSPLRCI